MSKYKDIQMLIKLNLIKHTLKLTTLETRRLIGDLIEVFKIIKVFHDLCVTDIFSLA